MANNISNKSTFTPEDVRVITLAHTCSETIFSYVGSISEAADNAADVSDAVTENADRLHQSMLDSNERVNAAYDKVTKPSDPANGNNR